MKKSTIHVKGIIYKADAIITDKERDKILDGFKDVLELNGCIFKGDNELKIAMV